MNCSLPRFWKELFQELQVRCASFAFAVVYLCACGAKQTAAGGAHKALRGGKGVSAKPTKKEITCSHDPLLCHCLAIIVCEAWGVSCVFWQEKHIAAKTALKKSVFAFCGEVFKRGAFLRFCGAFCAFFVGNCKNSKKTFVKRFPFFVGCGIMM